MLPVHQVYNCTVEHAKLREREDGEREEERGREGGKEGGRERRREGGEVGGRRREGELREGGRDGEGGRGREEETGRRGGREGGRERREREEGRKKGREGGKGEEVICTCVDVNQTRMSWRHDGGVCVRRRSRSDGGDGGPPVRMTGEGRRGRGDQALPTCIH